MIAKHFPAGWAASRRRKEDGTHASRGEQHPDPVLRPTPGRGPTSGTALGVTAKGRGRGTWGHDVGTWQCSIGTQQGDVARGRGMGTWAALPVLPAGLVLRPGLSAAPGPGQCPTAGQCQPRSVLSLPRGNPRPTGQQGIAQSATHPRPSQRCRLCKLFTMGPAAHAVFGAHATSSATNCGGGGCQDGAVGMRSPRCCSPKGCGVLGTGHEPPALPRSPSIAHHGAGTAHSIAPLSPSPKPPHPTAVTPSCCRSCSHLRLSGRTVAPELICPGRSAAGCLNGWALGCWGPTGTVPHWGRFPQQPLQHLPRV